MGDPLRFQAFGNFVVEHWPDRSLRIADVAGGKGGLHAALYQRGYRGVVTFDKRRNRADPARQHYRYEWFDDSVNGFDLILGMHPDAATDVAVQYALDRHLPYAVVPCCVRPTAWPYSGAQDYGEWMSHLAGRSGASEDELPIAGRSAVLYRTPKAGSYE